MSVIDKVSVGGTTYDVQDTEGRAISTASGSFNGLLTSSAWGTGGTDTTYGVTIKVERNRATINGTRTGTNYGVNYSLLNGIAKSSGSSGADVESDDLVSSNLVAKANHKYRITMRVVSGSYTKGTGGTSFRLYEKVGSGSVSHGGFVWNASISSPAEYVITKSYAADTLLGLGFFMGPNAGSFSNLVIEYVIEDITDSGLVFTTSSATPEITAVSGARYSCTATYVTSLSFTPSSTGICSVRFVSGTTPTVLTLPDTVVMPDWWTGVEASKTYEISVEDGKYAVVMVWG